MVLADLENPGISGSVQGILGQIPEKWRKNPKPEDAQTHQTLYHTTDFEDCGCQCPRKTGKMNDFKNPRFPKTGTRHIEM